MSIRDLLLNILIGFGVFAVIFVGSIVESFPLWILLILACIVWAFYIVIVIRDHQRDIKYPIIRYRPNSRQTTLYDQEEDH